MADAMRGMLASLHLADGDSERARAELLHVLGLQRQLADDLGQAATLGRLAAIDLRDGKLGDARRLRRLEKPPVDGRTSSGR
jgi:hypothetical protein